MMVEFKFKLPEENDEYETYRQAISMRIALEDISNFLRKKIKYESDGLTEEQYKVYEGVREAFHNILSDHEINLF